MKRAEPGLLSRLFKCQNQCCDTQDTRVFWGENGEVRPGILSAARTQESWKGLCAEYPINGRAAGELQVDRTWGRKYRGGVGLIGGFVVWGGRMSSRVGSVHACLIHAHIQRGLSEGAP